MGMADVDGGHARRDEVTGGQPSIRPGRCGQTAVLDFRRVDGLKLRIPEQDSELPLGEGVQAIGHDARGLHVAAADAGALARFCVDRRGVWLLVAEGAGGVHVNGRRVRRMAMLRPGDSIYLDGTQLLLVGEGEPELPGSDLGDGANGEGDPRVVLRGVGGQHHGRSFTLERPRVVGRMAEADIRVDDPAFAERHAQVLQVDGRIVLRDLGSEEGSLLNGRPVRDAVLHAGDQVAFDPQHRFVVEAPGRPVSRDAEDLEREADELVLEDRPAAPSSWRRWPWLLLSALLIAAALAALLTWGSVA
jgi:pSer/pThr/pTyr-binding forkhead associated (FHA) protein